ncbi:MAG: GIY-YIG nuclease family protein [Oscillospiraceae bacterium]|jgi:putative endonuclease|nr:GIY-YIG nuclease family protein [Oscillospiraceae bacterium]
MKQWCVYILRCRDGTLYTGATDDLQRRFAAHMCGKGAKYTRGRLPLEIVYSETCADRSAALRREAAIKHLSRTEKTRLICGQEALPHA